MVNIACSAWLIASCESKHSFPASQRWGARRGLSLRYNGRYISPPTATNVDDVLQYHIHRSIATETGHASFRSTRGESYGYISCRGSVTRFLISFFIKRPLLLCKFTAKHRFENGSEIRRDIRIRR